MKLMLRILRSIALVLLVLGTLIAGGLAFMFLRDRRRYADVGTMPSNNNSANPSVATSTSDVVATTNDSGLPWSRDEIRQLRGDVQNETIDLLMSKLRDTDGDAVGFNHLVDSTDRSTAQVRADLSRLSRLSHQINDHKQWPLEPASPPDGSTGRAYRIPRQYLDWWFED